MKNKKYKTMKVFNCQDMPYETLRMFFSRFEGKGNDCYVKWYIQSTKPEFQTKEEKTIDDWLIENGAKSGSKNQCGETVLIRHWW